MFHYVAIKLPGTMLIASYWGLTKGKRAREWQGHAGWTRLGIPSLTGHGKVMRKTKNKMFGTIETLIKLQKTINLYLTSNLKQVNENQVSFHNVLNYLLHDSDINQINKGTLFARVSSNTQSNYVYYRNQYSIESEA